jgi:myosin heavy chain 6/7
MSSASKANGTKDMCLLGDDIYAYHYVSQGKITIPGIDDAEEFEATHVAFEVLNFSAAERDDVYKISAAVMHMGEMKFKQKGREEQAEADGLEVSIMKINKD